MINAKKAVQIFPIGFSTGEKFTKPAHKSQAIYLQKFR
jgi:hypothetical protein